MPAATKSKLRKVELPGITVQAPWASLLSSKSKTVETRFYPLSKRYVDRPIAIVETPGRGRQFRSRVVAIVIFGPSFRYSTANEFYLDSARHLVSPTSPAFTWDSGKGRSKWGWPVKSIWKVKSDLPVGFRAGRIYCRLVPVKVPGRLPL